MKEARRIRFWLDLLVLALASLAVCLFMSYAASASGKTLKGQPIPSQRYICPQGNHGVPLVPTRYNILHGICVLP